MINVKKLNKAAIIAHTSQDIPTLANIYEKYGLLKIKERDLESACFYLTNAYAFALEAGLQSATEIHKVLRHHGRED